MKKIIQNLIFVMLLLVECYNQGVAETWEFGMKVTSNGTTLITGAPIKLYYQNDVDYGFLSIFRSCNSSSDNPNFRCDVDDSNTTNPSWAHISEGDYYLRVYDDYVHLHIGYPDENGADFELLYNANDHSFTISQHGR
ncbi:MAG: hypothetical protein KGJ59_10770, partial [Bacteroidota bacterium]|nr:hypothetical protein [Bacteroidota bacterium]